MQESLSLDVLTNWVFMIRADVDGAVWLSDDDMEARFYEKLAHKSSRIVPAQGLALPLLNSVAQRGVQGVVAVLRGIGTPEDAHNIFRPWQGDVASLLLMSSYGENVVAEVGGLPWLHACDKEVGSLREAIVRVACAVGRVRAVCRQEHLDALSPEKVRTVVDWVHFGLSWAVIDGVVIPGAGERLREECAADQARDTRVMLRECSGEDVMHLLAAATELYQPRGLRSDRQIDPGILATMLRAAFRPADIEGDELFWKMKKWERSNPSYPLLCRWRDLDPLGVVWDQRYWEGDLLAILKTLEPGGLLAVLKMDLDNFKFVNEKCGHTGGDEALRLYCSTVLDVVGAVGEVYRRGGDEVIVLAPSVSEGVARELAERTRISIETQFKGWGAARGVEPGPTASIGLTLAAAERPVSEILRLVDAAQKRAKEQGKNRVVVLNEL